MDTQFVKNAVGRWVPIEINGEAAVPFNGLGNQVPTGHINKAANSSGSSYSKGENKQLASLREALTKANLRDGMTISTHHHFRNGDLLAQQIFEIAGSMGVKNLRWFPSAAFPCHEHLKRYFEDGTISHIEGDINGSLAKFCSMGKMNKTAVLRSHGGRSQALQKGEVKIDIAVIGAASADVFGNANGMLGPSTTGTLGFAYADVEFAHQLIVVTDNIVPPPCLPSQIQGNRVNFVVEEKKMTIPQKIITDTVKLTNSPDKLLIAEFTAKFCEEAGLIKDDCSFYTGVGATSLSVCNNIMGLLRSKDIKARFAVGEGNKFLVEALEEGLIESIVDIQPYDKIGLESFLNKPNHIEAPPSKSFNDSEEENPTFLPDIAVLGASEVDLDFNANVLTQANGSLMHGMGAWQNYLLSKTVIIPISLFRDRVPSVVREVNTLCGPGELVDVVVTERGIAINPLRKDLIDRMRGSKLPIKSIEALQQEAEEICGPMDESTQSNELVAAVKWMDGTILDVIRKTS